MQTVLWGQADDAIVVDTTHFPIVMSTWFGHASAEAVRPFYAELHRSLERARREGKLMISLIDSKHAQTPSAEVRRLISELTDGWEKAGATPAAVRTIVVVENAAIRGVLQVLNWMHPRGELNSENAASLDAGVKRATALLRAGGHQPPPTLDRLTRPNRPLR